MTDKELKKLNRQELLEFLIEQIKENNQLRDELREKEEALKQRDIKLEQSGNIAEAALQINKVFEAAQAAADQYIENVRNTVPSAPAEAVEAAEESSESKAVPASLEAMKEEIYQREQKLAEKEKEYIFLKRFYKKYKRFADILDQYK